MSAVMARMIELTSPLGKDLLFRSLHGREELGRSSEFELSAVSTKSDVKPGDLLGKSLTVKLELLKGGTRYFNGYVTRFTQGGMVGRQFEYRLTMRSWLWFLTRTADCRIFQDKTVPDIIKEVFADHPVAMFEDGLNGSYKPRKYCVQYRESDFDFVSRLMEEEGIYYFFEHGDGKHTLKLVDAASSHKTLENKATIAYYPPGRLLNTDEEYIQLFTWRQSVTPGTVALTSFDFEKPKADLGVKSRLQQKHERADYEIFDWAGDYLQADHGDHYARVRIDELHSDFERCEAECNVREVAVGHLFTLQNAPRSDENGEYLIVGADYDLENNIYETGGSGDEATYRCTMSLLPSRQQFRPARITSRPIMGGPQTAVVTGPAGDEIYCDKHGRVKVQFHWDRYGKRDENSSCWMRVSQPWAGKDWGTVSIPRIGQEVIVDFMEGDPDQPVIIGRVYNGDNMHPYGLPAAAVISGIKTKTHKGSGYNEISADDTAGKEKVTIHGQYDMNTTIEHDQTSTIHNNRTDKVDVDDSETVGNNQKQSVGVNQDITIGSNQTLKVGANQTETIGANRSVTVGGNKSEDVGGMKTETIGIVKMLTIGAAYQVSVGAAMNESVGGLKSEQVGGLKTLSVAASSSEDVGTTKSVKAGTNITENAGAKFAASSGSTMDFSSGADYSVESKAKVLIKAASEITLTCGGASITLKSGGDIIIKGTQITIEGTAKIDEKAPNITADASAKNTVKGALVNVEASGINTVKGALVKIN
jgi:type VI secretion system secreted protein VgrG